MGQEGAKPPFVLCMYKFLLLLNTLKYLKWSQVYFRIYRKFLKPKITENYTGCVQRRNDHFVCASLFDEKITHDLSASFLNHTKKVNFPHDWNDECHSKLWVYNLHYFEDLLAVNAATKYGFHISLLDKWVLANPAGAGNGWEPYPISLRIPNILKAWQAGLPLEHRHFESLYAQASYLSNDLEKHLLGNHYFVNLKALLFAGVVFENQRWIGIGVEGLLEEIPEQILYDGANFELTPMYHSLILVDMLDMYNLCQAYPDASRNKLVNLLRGNIPKMLRFMSLMAHNDGGVSFFNDSVDGIAPTKKRIEIYAAQLGFETCGFDAMRVQVVDSDSSGYMIASANGAKLIFDAANVGPDYIPGHAHADTLSFELSIGDERVFVNTGTSQYGLGPQRIAERKTAAHNTVEIDGLDSSQVWSGFRVAERARVIERSSECDEKKALLRASHNGYKVIYGGPIHTRSLALERSSLRVVDKLSGDFNTAIARFYFHPDLLVRLEENVLKVSGAGFDMTSDLSGLKPKLSESSWHPEFGLSKVNWCLECKFLGSAHSVNFSWVLR